MHLCCLQRWYVPAMRQVLFARMLRSNKQWAQHVGKNVDRPLRGR